MATNEMHPRSTRNRPLLILGQKEVYTNNIRTPDRKKNLLVQELLGLDGANSFFLQMLFLAVKKKTAPQVTMVFLLLNSWSNFGMRIVEKLSQFFRLGYMHRQIGVCYNV